MEKRKYSAPEAYEETAKLYRELSIEWRAAGNEARAARCASIARAETIRAALSRKERDREGIWQGDANRLVAELAELAELGKVQP